MISKGITFGDVHSYDDLDLLLVAGGVEIPPAKPKMSFVDIPGGNGSIDLTEAHGEVKYNDRDCKFTFVLNPSGDLSEEAWEEKKTEVSNLLNGKRCRITLDKDADWYYIGRIAVDDYLSDKRIRQIVLTARVAPYKYKQSETVRTFALTDAETVVTLTNSRKTVVPVIKTTGTCKLVFNNKTFNLSAGERKLLDIELKEGNNTLTISGSGAISFTYSEGAL